MKKLFTGLFLVFTAVTTFAQSANEQARDAALAQAKSGYFEYTTASGDGININYSFAPAEPKTEVAIMLQSAQKSPLSVKIKDSKNKVVAKWIPEIQSDIYKETIDIKALPAGSYSYNIYWEDQLTKTILFNKQ